VFGQIRAGFTIEDLQHSAYPRPSCLLAAQPPPPIECLFEITLQETHLTECQDYDRRRRTAPASCRIEQAAEATFGISQITLGDRHPAKCGGCQHLNPGVASGARELARFFEEQPRTLGVASFGHRRGEAYKQVGSLPSEAGSAGQREAFLERRQAAA
jgi:hypothetical protein